MYALRGIAVSLSIFFYFVRRDVGRGAAHMEQDMGLRRVPFGAEFL